MPGRQAHVTEKAIGTQAGRQNQKRIYIAPRGSTGAAHHHLPLRDRMDRYVALAEPSVGRRSNRRLGTSQITLCFVLDH